MNRDVTAKEKVLLVILVLIILGFCYYRFVDQPIRKNLAKADAEYSTLQKELTEANVKIRELQRMQDEIDAITSATITTKAVLEAVNQALAFAPTALNG